MCGQKKLCEEEMKQREEEMTKRQSRAGTEIGYVERGGRRCWWFGVGNEKGGYERRRQPFILRLESFTAICSGTRKIRGAARWEGSGKGRRSDERDEKQGGD